MTKLLIVKSLHTVIWIFFNLVIIYLFYAVITNRIGKGVWICIGLIVAEGMVLMTFKGICPLTLVARKYNKSNKDNFDIFLPNWLAKYNKLIYSTLFAIVIILLLYRLTGH
ncbi:MAG: hypothetical protein ABI416_16870 [Ginsengibacter sp.]